MKTESTNAQKLHKGRAFAYKKDAEYLKKFIDPTTGKFYTRHTRPRVCPVCNSKKHHSIFFKDGGTYVKCEVCSMVYVNPVFRESSLKEYYKNVDSGQAQITQNESSFYREIYSLGLKAVTRFVKPNSILDVGCGSGFFLDIAKEKKWRTTGIELGLSDATLATQKGHIIFTEPLEKISFKEKFSAITLWDVFEHIVDGNSYLKQLKKLLTKDGVVFMQIPNSGSLAARVMREKCNMFHSLGHVNLYNPKTIARIAEKNGFDILYLTTVISEAAVLENYLNYEDPYFGGASFRGTVLDFIRPEDIHRHNLGYKMQIIMRPSRRK